MVEAELGDLEDLVARSASGVGVSGRPLVVHSAGRKLSPPPSPTSPQLSSLSLDEVQTKQDLDSWLKARKSKWREYRQDRLGLQSQRGQMEQRVFGRTTSDVISGLRDSGGGGEEPRGKRPMGIDDLVRSAARGAAHGTWQLVEMQETDLAGCFVVWAFTSPTQLQRLHVSVPRTLYLNCLDPPSSSPSARTVVDMGGRLVKKVLPHDRPSLHLYELDLPGGTSQLSREKDRRLQLVLGDPRVEVYEAKTPLLFRAITKLGCLAGVSNPSEINTYSNLFLLV